MSYQAGMRWPPLMVTGRSGAWGITNRTAPTADRSRALTRGTKSSPLAPRPCKMITLATAGSPVWASMVKVVWVMVSTPVNAGGRHHRRHIHRGLVRTGHRPAGQQGVHGGHHKHGQQGGQGHATR